MSDKFKAGDMVECVNNGYLRAELTVGQKYIVEYAYIYSDNIIVVNDKFEDDYYNTNFFKLADDKPFKTKDDISDYIKSCEKAICEQFEIEVQKHPNILKKVKVFHDEYLPIHLPIQKEEELEISIATHDVDMMNLSTQIRFKNQPIEYSSRVIRYKDEVIALAEMSLNALNHPKNIQKQPGKSYLVPEIIELIDEEFTELKEEIEEYELDKKNGRQRMKEELADVVACCVLLLDKINSLEVK